MEPFGDADARDRDLLGRIDSAMAESARRSGAWLACRPGCWECCRGPFEISEADARRLCLGLAGLEKSDPQRAARLRERAKAAGDLGEDDPCPALDPVSRTCDLYEWRPITCRLFGPPALCGPGEYGVCELCYQGASDAEIHACHVDPEMGDSLICPHFLHTSLAAAANYRPASDV